MNHLSEEQIVLHYYGDAEGGDEVRRHLSECPMCRGEFERVAALLRGIEPTEVPDPPPGFEAKVWLNLRDRLPGRLRKTRSGVFGWLPSPGRVAWIGGIAVLVVAAFLAGRYWPRQGGVPGNPLEIGKVNPQRIVLVAVGDHLERSQMLLVEIMHNDDKGQIDFSTEQQQARDLLDDNHLYRVSAQQVGDPQIAQVLDDLGRVLAEVANGPEEITPRDLQEIRSRIQSQGLLFKIRVVNSEVGSRIRRQQETSSNNGVTKL
jgi:hypothetical protein